MAMFTLQDAVGLAAQYGKNPTKTEQYNSAILGNYVLTDEQAKNEVARRETGIHLPDNGKGTSGGLPSGKLPGHPTFSTESPYSIEGLAAAQGGKWQRLPNNSWSFAPAQHTIDTLGNDGLAQYFNKYEKGNQLLLRKSSK